MANLLTVPFRFTAAGKAATVPQGDDEYYKQQLAVLVMTYKGERFVYDDLGMPDMVFSGFNASALDNQVAKFLPGVSSLDVRTAYLNDTTQTVTINFATVEESE